jgi:hypothetical protein
MNGYWQFFNVMQFLDNFAAVSQTGLDQGVYNAIPLQTFDASDIYQWSKKWMPLGLKLSHSFFDDEAKSAAKQLIALNAPAPTLVGL